MKKLILASICSIFTFGAFADDMPQPPMGGPNDHSPHGDIMANLTDEQKSCIETYGCPKMERPARPENGEKPEPGTRPEMTEEQKTAMECMRKAMESCGVQMPTRPDHPGGPRPDGERPERPNE